MRFPSRGLALILAALLLCGSFACAEESAPPAFTTGIARISGFGNLHLELRASELLSSGYAVGDLVAVSIAGRTIVMPLCTEYSDVDSGDAVARLTVMDSDDPDSVVLAVNHGSMAAVFGVAVRVTVDEGPGYRWDYSVPEPVEVTVALHAAGGYLGTYAVRHLERYAARGDCPDLSDEDWANFRAVAVTGIADGVLYRSSSPVNPVLGRSAEAARAVAAHGIRTVLDLADSPAELAAHEGYALSGYARLNVIARHMSVAVLSLDFAAGLAEMLRFMIAHEGPYLVHCLEGKDRTGFAIAVLECLAGAPLGEIEADYMLTYRCLFGVLPGTEQYRSIAEHVFFPLLRSAFGVDSLEGADLRALAEQYLLGTGLTEGEIGALRQRLSAE